MKSILLLTLATCALFSLSSCATKEACEACSSCSAPTLDQGTAMSALKKGAAATPQGQAANAALKAADKAKAAQ